jgi:hypothetical protein
VPVGAVRCCCRPSRLWAAGPLHHTGDVLLRWLAERVAQEVGCLVAGSRGDQQLLDPGPSRNDSAIDVAVADRALGRGGVRQRRAPTACRAPEPRSPGLVSGRPQRRVADRVVAGCARYSGTRRRAPPRRSPRPRQVRRMSARTVGRRAALGVWVRSQAARACRSVTMPTLPSGAAAAPQGSWSPTRPAAAERARVSSASIPAPATSATAIVSSLTVVSPPSAVAGSGRSPREQTI